MWRRPMRILVVLGGLLVVAAVSGATSQWLATRNELASTSPQGQLVVVGGHRLHLWCMGAGAPAVILDTGLGGSSAEWGFVQPEVARFTRVCSYDRAGMGYSDPGPSPRTARRIASELATLVVDRSGIDGRLVVAGASKSTDCASRVATSSMNSSIFAQRLRSAIDQIATSIIDAKHDHSGSSSRGWHDDLPPRSRATSDPAERARRRVMPSPGRCVLGIDHANGRDDVEWMVVGVVGNTKSSLDGPFRQTIFTRPRRGRPAHAAARAIVVRRRTARSVDVLPSLRWSFSLSPRSRRTCRRAAACTSLPSTHCGRIRFYVLSRSGVPRGTVAA
jgi:hypothetical protein